MNPTPGSGSGPVPVILDRLADIVAVVPYLLGFHPELSMVALIIDPADKSITATLRFDLPDRTDSTPLAHELGDMMTANHATQVLLIGYGPDMRVSPIMDALRHVLHGRDITVVEALRVEEGRYWSYLCPDPGCCPPDGTPFDPTTAPATSPVLAALNVLADRDALVATLAPVDGLQREAMRAATVAAHTRAAVMLADPAVTGQTWYAEGRKRVREALERTADGGQVTEEEAAWLGVLLTMIVVRDAAITFITAYPATVLSRLWGRLTRLVEEVYAPAPATLAAMTAYYNGDGALARIAVDRALAADPAYRMAYLMRGALNYGLPPKTISDISTPDLEGVLAEHVRQNAHLIRPTLHPLI
ncbi:DUF4192 domain-containing protein [Streptosporangium saharense]|uniref:DUF4192 domain-containing protein n=1 Tax=Streptosporangium saharense TaxID=1706840 RepID=UPI003678BA47